MADNQEELKELFETGVTQRQMDAAKQKYAAARSYSDNNILTDFDEDEDSGSDVHQPAKNQLNLDDEKDFSIWFKDFKNRNKKK